MKFLDIFNPIKKGDFGLTEEAVYRSIQFGNERIPLWGGNQDHRVAERYVDEKGKTKEEKEVTVFDGEGIILSLDGSAGSMTYKTQERFALNNHAGFITKKSNAAQDVDLEFFSIFFQPQLEEASVSDGSKTLSTQVVYSLDFDIPSYQIQKQIMNTIRPIQSARAEMEHIRRKIEHLKDKMFSEEYARYQAKNIPFGDVFDYLGGNSGLTEKEIYQSILHDGERYEVLSSSTLENTKLGVIPQCRIDGKKIKVFEGREGILVARNGDAGATSFLKKGKYTTNDHAYILFLSDECRYEVSLQWIIIQYRATFLEYSSSSANGTWNMTGFFSNVKIDIPTYSDQLKIVMRYQEIDELVSKLLAVEDSIQSVFSRIFSEA